MPSRARVVPRQCVHCINRRALLVLVRSGSQLSDRVVTAHHGQAAAATGYLRTQVRVVGSGDARRAGEVGAIPLGRRDVRLGKTSETRQQVLEPRKPVLTRLL
jgi:hypothetical protein